MQEIQQIVCIASSSRDPVRGSLKPNKSDESAQQSHIK